jgi:16S rRNA (guanine527-N7)-methyltransferase
LLAFAALLEKWNKSFNLISRQDIQRLGSRHILDSLSGVALLRGRSVLDLGSGAGLPGVPLAIAAPERHFLLCDRSERRTRFLRQVVHGLQLSNVDVWHGDFGQHFPETQSFDTVVARGVATVAEVWAMVRSQLATDGRVLVYESTRSGGDTNTGSQGEGVAQTNHLQQCIVSRFRFQIPGLAQPHTIVCVDAAAD